MPQAFFGPAQEPFAVRSMHRPLLDQQEQQGILTRCSSNASYSIVSGHALYAGTNEEKREPSQSRERFSFLHTSSIRDQLYFPFTPGAIVWDTRVIPHDDFWFFPLTAFPLLAVLEHIPEQFSQKGASFQPIGSLSSKKSIALVNVSKEPISAMMS